MITKDIFKGLNIVVVGDVMVDRYEFYRKEKQSSEADVPVVKLVRTVDRLGGAANVAANIVSLGGNALLVGYCGIDDNANVLYELLAHKSSHTIGSKFDYDNILPTFQAPTTMKRRLYVDGAQIIRIDEEKVHPIKNPYVACKVHKICSSTNIDGIIISDYSKGALHEENIDDILSTDILTIVDPKKPFQMYSGANIIVPNLNEFNSWKPESNILTFQIVLQEGRFETVILTCGSNGIRYYTKREIKEYGYFPAIDLDSPEIDPCGASDTVIAALALAQSKGFSVEDSVEFANIVAGLVVGKFGTSTVSIDEVIKYYKNR